MTNYTEAKENKLIKKKTDKKETENMVELTNTFES